MNFRKSFSSLHPSWLLVCWLLIALISTTGLYVQQQGAVGWWHILPVKLAVWLFWGLYGLFIFWLARRFGWQSDRWWQTLGFHLPFSVLSVVIHVFFYSSIIWLLDLGGMRANGVINIFLFLLPALFEWYFILYWTIVIFTFAFSYYNKYRDQELQTLQLEKRLIMAQLQALKMQLHPHFLFNTLNTIVTQVRTDQKSTAIRMLSGLSDLLRTTLNNSDRQLVGLQEEIQFIKQYLELEKERFGDKLQPELDLDPNSLSWEVPSFLLQPLVENAVYHGMAKRLDARILRIRSAIRSGRLELEIYNDGPALPDNFDPAYYSGIGLSNTIERLSQFYAADFDLSLQNTGSGVSVLLSLPSQKNRHG